MNRPVGNKFLVLTVLLYHLVAGVQEIFVWFRRIDIIDACVCRSVLKHS